MPRKATTLPEFVRQIAAGEREDHFIASVLSVVGNQVWVQRIGADPEPQSYPSARGEAATLKTGDIVYVISVAGSYHVAHAVDS